MLRALLTLTIALGGCTQADIVSRDAGAGEAGARDSGERDAGRFIGDAGMLDAGTDCPYETVDRTGMPDGCERALPPGRPLCDEGTPEPERWYALRAIQFQVGNDQGLDLDGFCTGSSTGPANCVPSDVYIVDDPGGIDNSFRGNFIGNFDTAYQFSTGRTQTLEEDTNTSLEAGFRNILLRLTDYNGASDDQNVEVAYANSVCGKPSMDSSPCPRMAPAAPLGWGGDDVFFPSADAFLGGDVTMPIVRDVAAYVRAGRLIARLALDIEIIFATASGSVRLTAQDATIVASIEPGGGRLQGFVATRWAESSALLAAEAFGLCPGDMFYPPFRDAVSDSLDVPTGPGGPAVPCDAISLVIGFEGYPVEVGAPRNLPPPVDLCP